jgi:3-oxoadipate CoA-transferase alpha subunit
MDKRFDTVAAAVADNKDGSTVLVGGFGDAGTPATLIDALIDKGARNLTLVSNNAGGGLTGLARLLDRGQVRRILCSYPRSAGSVVFERLYAAGEIELEVVPRGTLAERIRAAGAGIGAFHTPTGVGTDLAEGKEVRTIDGRDYPLEQPIDAEVALVKGKRADRWGNTTYDKSARNFGPIMRMAATTTIVEVDEIVALGALDPEAVVTPGLFVNRVVLSHSKSPAEATP